MKISKGIPLAPLIIFIALSLGSSTAVLAPSISQPFGGAQGPGATAPVPSAIPAPHRTSQTGGTVSHVNITNNSSQVANTAAQAAE